MESICVNVVSPVHFFPIPQGTLPWQPILWQNCGKITYPSAFIDLPFRNGMGYHNRNMRINSENDALRCVRCVRLETGLNTTVMQWMLQASTSEYSTDGGIGPVISKHDSCTKQEVRK